jgi:hypothetical protein
MSLKQVVVGRDGKELVVIPLIFVKFLCLLLFLPFLFFCLRFSNGSLSYFLHAFQILRLSSSMTSAFLCQVRVTEGGKIMRRGSYDLVKKKSFGEITAIYFRFRSKISYSFHTELCHLVLRILDKNCPQVSAQSNVPI